ncbi:MAG: hypothetical protein Q9183_003108 [Haloplaca sp. 2 TL-2023]
MSTAPGFERIDHDYLVEEEMLPGYDPKHYYPVKLGEVLHERYRVIGKLGYGAASTVWLCRDLQEQYEYVALKVYINCSKYRREELIYEKINNLQTIHEGRNYIRKLYDSFELRGPHGTHICLVHQPLGTPLDYLKELMPDKVLTTEILRQTMQCVLTGLQFLHKEAQVIHTDLQSSNMMLGIHDESVLARFEQAETENPYPRKELDDRNIYMSRPLPLTKVKPRITDFSEARLGVWKNTELIMPHIYRAPEVILGLQWSYPVDIWGFGMVLWDLFQPKRLFRSRGSEKYSEAHHLAEMIAIMGPPPLDFLGRCGEKSDEFWEKDGTWKDLAPIPDTSLEREDQRLEGEEKQQFITFMRKMLQWKPEDRQNAGGVYWDEWFLADLIESGEVVRDDEDVKP